MNYTNLLTASQKQLPVQSLDKLSDQIPDKVEKSVNQNQSTKFTQVEKLYLESVEYDPFLENQKCFPKYIFHSHAALHNVLKKEKKELSLQYPEHLHQLSVAFRYFSSNDLKDLKEDDRLLCLKLHEEYRKMELNWKLPCLSPSIDGKMIDGVKISKKLYNLSLKGLAIEALGQIFGFIANDYTMSEMDFDRIFPNDSFKAEAIPALLASDIKLSQTLQQRLTTRRLDWLEKRISGLNENKLNALPNETLEDACDFIEHLNNTDIPANIDQAVAFERLVDEAESVLPSESSLKEEVRNSEIARNQANSRQQRQKYSNGAAKAASEIGKAIHTWVQHSHREKSHLKMTKQAHQEFTACMEALSLECEMDEFYYKSRPEIQNLIKEKLIQNHEKAIDQRLVIAQEYSQEVLAAKEALKKCRSTFNQLGSQKEGLRELGSLLTRYQKKVDRHHLKRSRLLKIGHAICDGIKIAGLMTFAFAAPALGAASAVSGASEAEGGELCLIKQGIHFLDDQNEEQWGKSQNRHRKKLGNVLEGAKALHTGREATQEHLTGWMKHRHQQREFLVMNPHLFHTITYQRFLLEELAEGKNGIQEIKRRQQHYESRIVQNTQTLEQLSKEEQKLKSQLVCTNFSSRSRKFKSILSRLSHVRTEIANKSSENSLLQIDLNALQDVLLSGTSTLGAIEGRLNQIQYEDSLPAHLRSDSNKLPIDFQIESSDEHLRQLQARLSNNQKLSPEEFSDLNQQLRLGLVQNIQLKQELVYSSLKEASATKIYQELPSLLINSVQRQNSLASPNLDEAKKIQTHLSQETAAREKFENAKKNLVGPLKAFLTSQEKETKAKADFDRAEEQIKNLLPNREIKYRPKKGEPKTTINLQDHTHPHWEKVIDKKSKKSEHANLEAAKALKASVPALRSALEAARQDRGNAEKIYQEAVSNAENSEQQYRSAQDARMASESQMEKRKQTIQAEKHLQQSFWQIIEEMPPQERLKCCEALTVKLGEEKSENFEQEHIRRTQQAHCHQIARHAYRQLWDGIDPAQRINRFESHEAAAKNRLVAIDQLLSSNSAEIDALPSGDPSNQHRIEELQEEKQKLLTQKNIEKDNISALLLGHNLDEKILDLRDIAGENTNPQLRTFEKQHIEHLNQIRQELPLRHMTDLSHTFELLIGDISARWDREWQHQARVVPQFVTKALELAANFVYLRKAYETLTVDSPEFIEIKKNEGIATDGKSYLDRFGQAAPVISFFLDLTSKSQIGGYFIPTLNCMRSFVQLCNIVQSINTGLMPTLQEQFLEFAKEHKKKLDQYHSEVREQLKDNQKLLQEVDQHMRALDEEMKEAFKAVEQKIEASQQRLERRFDLQERRNQIEACVRYCIEQRNKRDESTRELIWSYIEVDSTSAKDLSQPGIMKTLKKVQYYNQLSRSPNLNGFNAGRLFDISSISTNPKFFTGWLGSHLEQQGAAGLNHNLPSPLLLISSAESFLKVCEKIHSNPQEKCSSELNQLMLSQAKTHQHDVGQLLSLMAELDPQLERAALALEEAKLSWIKKCHEPDLKRKGVILEHAKNEIIASRNQVKALVDDPSFFVKRFAITRNILHLLNCDLPPLADKVNRLLHPPLTTGEKIGLVLATPVILFTVPVAIVMSPLLYTAYVLDQRDRRMHRKSEFELEEVPYAIGGLFGATNVTKRFEEISLIALAQLSLPEPINLLLPDHPHEKRKSVSLMVRSGSVDNSQQKFAELKPLKLSIKASKWRPTVTNYWGDKTLIKVKENREEIFETSSELTPMVEAEVIVYFNKLLSRTARFTPPSWVQLPDLSAISKVMGMMGKLKEYQEKSAEIPCVYQSFLEMQLNELKNESDFAKWLGEYKLIPSHQGGIPLVLPAKVLDMIDGVLKSELIDRRLSNQPTLIPCYEWILAKDLDLYALEIIMKTDEKNSTECHRFRLFSIGEKTIEAFKATFEESDKDSQILFDHSLLLYVMYCGFWELGMPSDSSYKLASGKAVLSGDEPFAGFYKFLELQASNINPVQNFLDWESIGNESYDKVKKAVSAFNFQFFDDPLFKEYRHQYYLSLLLAKLQYSVESKKAHKHPIQGEDFMQYESASLRAMFADNGLPWPETFELSKEILEGVPKIGSLKGELEHLPFSKTADRLADFFLKLQEITNNV